MGAYALLYSEYLQVTNNTKKKRMRTLQIFVFISLFAISCKKNVEIQKQYPKLPPKAERIKIHWLTNKTNSMAINPLLSHQKGFECDSVIGIDYIGFEGEHFYYPINEKGELINTIIKKQKLNRKQFLKLNSILGNRDTYKNPNIVGCYEPRLGFVYFKNNKVIGQTQICLSCAQLRSTAETVEGELGELFNEKATKELNELRIELGFKEEH
jgi:hypothetical protein